MKGEDMKPEFVLEGDCPYCGSAMEYFDHGG